MPFSFITFHCLLLSHISFLPVGKLWSHCCRQHLQHDDKENPMPLTKHNPPPWVISLLPPIFPFLPEHLQLLEKQEQNWHKSKNHLRCSCVANHACSDIAMQLLSSTQLLSPSLCTVALTLTYSALLLSWRSKFLITTPYTFSSWRNDCCQPCCDSLVNNCWCHPSEVDCWVNCQTLTITYK